MLQNFLLGREERAGNVAENVSSLQLEAGVSVYCFIASASRKMFYRAGCCVSSKNASPISEMPEVQRCLVTFQGCHVFFWLKLMPRNLDKILHSMTG